jgi:predicted protein tyrosine phosphatase
VVKRREVLYLHCWGGCGRTGLVAACLLGALYRGMTADEAMARVNSYFFLRAPYALTPHKRSPETPEQHEQVRAFFRTYLNSS